MGLYTVLRKPIVTEKTANMGLVQPRYAFEVDSWATKIDVKKAIQELYGVEVAKVNSLTTRQKFKYGKKRGMQIKRRETKKVYVTLKDPKKTIDVIAVK